MPTRSERRCARDLRIAREIQMGILPGRPDGAVERHRARGSRRHRAGAPGRRRSLRGAARRRRPRRRRARRRVGKGIPAALFMAVAVTVLRTLARQFAEPDEILRRLNDELAEQNPRGMFVTLQCLVFDLSGQRVSCAGAGHHQLAICSPNQAPRLACPSSGRPAGLMALNPDRARDTAAQPPAIRSCCSRTACRRR